MLLSAHGFPGTLGSLRLADQAMGGRELALILTRDYQ